MSSLIAMIRAGRTLEELAWKYEPSAQTIRNWITQADIDARHRRGVTSDDRDGGNTCPSTGHGMDKVVVSSDAPSVISSRRPNRLS